MTTAYKILVVIAFILLFSPTVLYIKSLHNKLDEQRVSYEAMYKDLAAREAEIAAMAAETRELHKKLQEVYANDADAKAWADTPCPDGVLNCLRY